MRLRSPKRMSGREGPDQPRRDGGRRRRRARVQKDEDEESNLLRLILREMLAW